MKISERTLHIGSASLLALSFIAVAYFFSGHTFLSSNRADAASTDALLKAYATKDTDDDGLPDWQEALYGTDPNKAISNPYGIPDGEAAKEGKLTPTTAASQLPGADQGTTTPPLTDADFGGVPAPVAGSITEQFSQQFLQQVTQAGNGQSLDDATQQQIVTNLLSTISQQVSGTLVSTYGTVDVHTSATVTLSQYSASVESAIENNDVANASNPYDLMLTVVQSTDPKEQASAEAQLAATSRALGAMAAQLRTISVPTSQTSSHVLLVQSFETLSRSTGIIANYQKDPIATLGAISAYNTASDSFSQALNQMATSILAAGEPGAGDPGYYIVALARVSKS